jgi:prepilin-type N-terminal cleavage/methylation domain-containing protein
VNIDRRIVLRESGFTLIELIIVVTILAMLSVGVVPVFNGSFRGLESDHGVRDFAAMVRYAEERAITAGVEYRLYIYTDENSYGLQHLVKMDGEDKVFEPVTVQRQKTVKLPRTLTFKNPRAKKDRKGGGYYVAFYPSGACDDARINISSSEGKSYYVDTKGGIGKLKVSQ